MFGPNFELVVLEEYKQFTHISFSTIHFGPIFGPLLVVLNRAVVLSSLDVAVYRLFEIHISHPPRHLLDNILMVLFSASHSQHCLRGHVHMTWHLQSFRFFHPPPPLSLSHSHNLWVLSSDFGVPLLSSPSVDIKCTCPPLVNWCFRSIRRGWMECHWQGCPGSLYLAIFLPLLYLRPSQAGHLVTLAQFEKEEVV